MLTTLFAQSLSANQAVIGMPVESSPFSVFLVCGVAIIVALLIGFFVGTNSQRKKMNLQTRQIVDHTKQLEQKILEQNSSRKQLHQLAYYDEITSLPNRLFFNERLHETLIEEKGIVSVAIIDLDRFKNFNDTMGHENGNALLRLVGKRISTALPEGTLLARYGGDEFAILADGKRPEECVSISEQVALSLKEPITLLGREHYVTASIGLSHYPSEASNISELLQQADIAMYRAKQEGGNSYCLYDADIGKRIIYRMELETSLRRALVNGEMWLEYQPQVDLNTNEVLAVEALLRWQHPERGMMDTLEFIQIAEETGQIIPIGEWVMEEAFAQAAQWRDQGVKPFKIAINLSSKQVEKKGFVPFVRQLIEEYDFPPAGMELEITEHVLIDREPQTQKTMGELKDLG
ncbi:MAG: diguanylate cyclase, partial [Arenicellales bacterium]|nr:diguanylate cyclase [Arenicellales bacterium]